MVITELSPYDAAVLLAVNRQEGWHEITRLSGITPVDWWQEMVDEFACLVAEDN